MSKVDPLIEILKQQGITSAPVLQAIRAVPRDLFVPELEKDYAYANYPIQIGHGQTISQPYIVAQMTQLLLDAPSINRVLEIGTGSGYQAAILSRLVKQVYTVERIKALYQHAKEIFAKHNFSNINCLYGDGWQGWPEQQPFDGIIVTAAADHFPEQLLKQLRVGGRMVLPLGDSIGQSLKLIIKTAAGFEDHTYEPVIFVPMLSGTE